MPMEFMSPGHVGRMNELLAASQDVAGACAGLDRDYVVAYELTGGPEGTVHWVLRFDRVHGARFSLAPPPHADLTHVGDWASTIRAARAVRDSAGDEPRLEMRGDPSVLEYVAVAYAAAQRTATVEVEFPDL